jgi:hypothetical protein
MRRGTGRKRRPARRTRAKNSADTPVCSRAIQNPERDRTGGLTGGAFGGGSVGPAGGNSSSRRSRTRHGRTRVGVEVSAFGSADRTSAVGAAVEDVVVVVVAGAPAASATIIHQPAVIA